MTSVDIPTTEALAERLTGLDRLLTARRWERAAIVWAFTREGINQHDESRITSDAPVFPCSVREFARLGFAGLASQNTVRKYRGEWQRAIDSGAACSVSPGDVDVELPDLEWGASVVPFPATEVRGPQMSRADAEELDRRLWESTRAVQELLFDILENGGWRVLGYVSWEEFCIDKCPIPAQYKGSELQKILEDHRRTSYIGLQEMISSEAARGRLERLSGPSFESMLNDEDGPAMYRICEKVRFRAPEIDQWVERQKATR